jgi:dTDP-4-dehydrorhamnose reductase
VRLLVLGAAGIVGRATLAEARRRGWAAAGRTRAELDVTDRAAVERELLAARAELVVNAAAFTQVDRCESEPELAHRVNSEAVAGLVEACARAGSRLLHLSTDYVFDGRAEAPYAEDAAPRPLSVYGASKLGGERRALADPRNLVVRTSAVFGRGGANFVDAIAGRLGRGEPLRVVGDQVTAPTYAPFLARALLDLGESGATGLVHYRNREATSWHELARAIAERIGSRAAIERISSAELPRPATRPAYSVLAVGRFERRIGRAVERWSDGLDAHLTGAAAPDTAAAPGAAADGDSEERA